MMKDLSLSPAIGWRGVFFGKAQFHGELAHLALKCGDPRLVSATTLASASSSFSSPRPSHAAVAPHAVGTPTFQSSKIIIACGTGGRRFKSSRSTKVNSSTYNEPDILNPI
ncbi:hypothetical protein [Labrys sp. 22185]|uniref:hypothetical protein n=1 Tax=Labrys sp. 22185 TaxID=3453888 RepID=UPI003F8301FA